MASISDAFVLGVFITLLTLLLSNEPYYPVLCVVGLLFAISVYLGWEAPTSSLTAASRVLAYPLFCLLFILSGPLGFIIASFPLQNYEEEPEEHDHTTTERSESNPSGQVEKLGPVEYGSNIEYYPLFSHYSRGEREQRN